MSKISNYTDKQIIFAKRQHQFERLLQEHVQAVNRLARMSLIVTDMLHPSTQNQHVSPQDCQLCCVNLHDLVGQLKKATAGLKMTAMLIQAEPVLVSCPEHVSDPISAHQPILLMSSNANSSQPSAA